VKVPLECRTIGEWTDHRHTRELPKQTHGRLFLQASGLRKDWPTLIQDQRHDGDIPPVEGIKRQQRMIDSP
jgi:hypothetical protein